jgi:hypothetical protein
MRGNRLVLHHAWRDSVDLDAVAGRQHQRFGAAAFAKGLSDVVAARVTLTRFHIRSVMADANAEEIHRVR